MILYDLYLHVCVDVPHKVYGQSLMFLCRVWILGLSQFRPLEPIAAILWYEIQWGVLQH